MGVIHALGLWHGVLAFGFGLVLGTSFDTVPAPVAMPEPAPARAAAPAPAGATGEPVSAGRRRRFSRRRPVEETAVADAPTTAEREELAQREAAHNAAPRTVNVGPHHDTERVPETMD
jgi:hypothetical protein